MAFRLQLIECCKEFETSPAKAVQFGDAYLCEVPDGQRGKSRVGPCIVVVIQSVKMCKNAYSVYVAPLADNDKDDSFRFQIEEVGPAGVPAQAVIDLSRIEMWDVRKLRIKLGRLELRELWRLDGRLKDMFGAGQWGK